MNRAVAVTIGVLVAVALAFFLGSRKNNREEVAVPAGQEEVSHRIAEQEEQIRVRDEKIRKLEEEIRRLEEKYTLKDAITADFEPGKGDKKTSGPTAGSPGPTRESGGAEEKPTKEVTWESLAERVAGLMDVIQKAGDKPTPELMKSVSEFMQEVAEVQARLGLDDPGFVTESPAFKTHALARFLEKSDNPLTEAEKADLFQASETSMGEFLDAARVAPDDFALEGMKKVLDSNRRFQKKVDRIITPERVEGLPFAKRSRNTTGKAENTSWPDQSSVGVKDLDGAVESIANRWKKKMSIPEAEHPSLEAIVREFIDRSHAAKLRYPTGENGELTPEARNGLDQEIASFEVEALKRAHDSLNLDEETKKKVRAYRSLDRFEIGGSGSWSRSGSFGGFTFSGGSREEESRGR